MAVDPVAQHLELVDGQLVDVARAEVEEVGEEAAVPQAGLG
ncbi:hypothetical protein [Streptomyces sp. NPDC012888]